jgi:hypothetical protein
VDLTLVRPARPLVRRPDGDSAWHAGSGLELVTRGNGSGAGFRGDIMARVEHLSTAELEAGLSDVRDSPSDGGTVELIVRRPAVDEREVLAEAALDVDAGLAGDTWPVRGSSRTADGSSHPDMR